MNKHLQYLNSLVYQPIICMASSYTGKMAVINIFGFFCRKRDATELRQLTIVLVLSTDKLIQFGHGIPLSENLLAMESNILHALALSLPPVKRVSKQWSVVILDVLTSSIRRLTGFILSIPVSLLPVPGQKG